MLATVGHVNFLMKSFNQWSLSMIGGLPFGALGRLGPDCQSHGNILRDIFTGMTGIYSLQKSQYGKLTREKAKLIDMRDCHLCCAQTIEWFEVAILAWY